MKLALYLVVVILTVNLSQEEEVTTFKECSKKCEEEEGSKNIRSEDLKYVCAQDGNAYKSRCDLDCHTNYIDKDIKEAECKPGSFSHCWNNCSSDEKKMYSGYRQDKETLWCLKEPPHYYSTWPCFTKCMEKATENKDLEFVPCKETNVKEMIDYKHRPEKFQWMGSANRRGNGREGIPRPGRMNEKMGPRQRGK